MNKVSGKTGLRQRPKFLTCFFGLNPEWRTADDLVRLTLLISQKRKKAKNNESKTKKKKANRIVNPSKHLLGFEKREASVRVSLMWRTPAVGRLYL